jgi:nitrous oxide reductase accessory protein NosL
MRSAPTRRGFNALLSGAAYAALAAGCARAAPAPKTIKLGRDLCEHCNMVVSELRFAAQRWDKQSVRARVFDDVGCAVAFAAYEKGLDDEDAPFWAADAQNPEPANPKLWLDARQASYKDGFHTPMGYGVAAAPAGVWPFSYAAMLEVVRKKALCRPTSAT